MNPEIKPCPFCGSPARVHSDKKISCTNPNCSIYLVFFGELVWNNRPAEQDLLAMIGKLRRQIFDLKNNL